MTNYNDGKWHGWDGGSMPVHGDSVVTFAGERVDYFEEKASDVDWGEGGGFKVVEEYVEPPAPREVWVAYSDDGHLKDVADYKNDLEKFGYNDAVKFREVLDDES